MKINQDILIGNTGNKLKDLEVKGKILWTNPNPSSSFSSQKVAVDLTNYDMYEVLFKTWSGENNIQTTGRIPKTTNIMNYSIGNQAHGPYNYFRNINAIDNTGITFGIGIQAAEGTRVLDDTRCVPYYIIGYKTGLF